MLNLLAGRLVSRGATESAGQILVNGQKRDFDRYRSISCYVLQVGSCALAVG